MAFYSRRANYAQTKNIFFLNMTAVVILLSLSIVFLVQTNSVVAKNFELRKVKSDFEQRQKISQQLLVSLTQTRSLTNLETSVKDLNLVAVDKINYLNINSGGFALSQP